MLILWYATSSHNLLHLCYDKNSYFYNIASRSVKEIRLENSGSRIYIYIYIGRNNYQIYLTIQIRRCIVELGFDFITNLYEQRLEFSQRYHHRRLWGFKTTLSVLIVKICCTDARVHERTVVGIVSHPSDKTLHYTIPTCYSG